MIAPEVPAGGSERQAVLDDQPDGQVNDTMGVVAARGRQIGGVGVEVRATARAVVLGVGQDDVVWSSGQEIAEVVQGALELAIAVRAVSAPWARPPLVVSTASEDLGLGQVLNPGDAFGGIGAIFSWAWHGSGLLIAFSYQEIRPILPASSRQCPVGMRQCLQFPKFP